LKFAGAIAAGLALWLLTTDLLRRVQLRVPLFTTGQRSPGSHRNSGKERPCVDALS